MFKNLFILLILTSLQINLIGQNLTQYYFDRPAINYNKANYFQIKFNGNNYYELKSRRNFWTINQLNTFSFYSFSLEYLPDINGTRVYNKEVIYRQLMDCINDADSINSFLKSAPNLRCLIMSLQNPKFSDSIINHLTKNLKFIDTLIIGDYSKSFKIDSAIKMTFPAKNDYFNSVSYLRIQTESALTIPEYVLAPKTKPLETLVLRCDSLNVKGISHLSSLKKLVLINTKNMATILPLIMQLKSLEELYVGNTDIITLPDSLLLLPSLKTLVLFHNKRLRKFPVNIDAYNKLSVFGFTNTKTSRGRRLSKKVHTLSRIYPDKFIF